jgi:hypothetical protein
MEPVGFVDDDKGGRVSDLSLASLVVLVSLIVDRVHRRSITGRASWSFEDLAPPCLVTKSDRFEHGMGFPLDWPGSNASQPLACSIQVRSHPRGSVYDPSCVQDSIELEERHRCIPGDVLS